MEANGVTSWITESVTNLTAASTVPAPSSMMTPSVTFSSLNYTSANETSTNIQQNNAISNFQSYFNTSVENNGNGGEINYLVQNFLNTHLCGNNCNVFNCIVQQSRNSTNIMATPEAFGFAFLNLANFNFSSSFHVSNGISGYNSNFFGIAASTGNNDSVYNGNQLVQHSNTYYTISNQQTPSYYPFYLSAGTSYQHFPVANSFASTPANIFQPQPSQSNQPPIFNEGFQPNNAKDLQPQSGSQTYQFIRPNEGFQPSYGSYSESDPSITSFSSAETFLNQDVSNSSCFSNDKVNISSNQLDNNDNQVMGSSNINWNSDGNDLTRKRRRGSTDEYNTEHRIKSVKREYSRRNLKKDRVSKLREKNAGKRSNGKKYNVLRPNMKRENVWRSEVSVYYDTSEESSDKEN